MNYCLKKNQSTPRPSEHPPVMGEMYTKYITEFNLKFHTNLKIIEIKYRYM